MVCLLEWPLQTCIKCERDICFHQQLPHNELLSTLITSCMSTNWLIKLFVYANYVVMSNQIGKYVHQNRYLKGHIWLNQQLDWLS